MGLFPKISVYQDDMSTAASNKVGHEELAHREVLNTIVDVMNTTWARWSPTIVYTGTGPHNVGAASSVTEVAKYMQHGSTVFFQYQCVAGAQSDINCTNVIIPLPTTTAPVDDDTYPVIQALALNSAGTASYYDPQAYIDMTTAGARHIKLRDFHKLIGTNPYAIYMSGFYQVV